MSARLVALDEGSDIPVDRAMVVVGRHPQCDARLDSIRISRRHCCMTPDHGDLIVRDLGSTNGIRINGQRVEMGRLRPGDELSIAHIRYRLDPGTSQEMTQVASDLSHSEELADGHLYPFRTPPPPGFPSHVAAVMAPPPAAGVAGGGDSPLAAAVRDLLPSSIAERCRIQVIVRMDSDSESTG
jgi:predicted component of type VI protein secretion system